VTDSPLWFLSTIAARTAIVLIVLLVGVRLFGKREMAGMTLFDLVLVLTLANAVQNAMTVGSGMLGVGIVSGGTLLLINGALGRLFVRRPSIEAGFTGVPVVIVRDGQLQVDAMQREGITPEEVLAAARGYGLSRLDQVSLAVLETDGSLSIVPADEARP
jgi:uncharacterized membrane protein YcaP (DUF421 family)